jgi:NADH-quinone oxidoreductase subunit J
VFVIGGEFLLAVLRSPFSAKVGEISAEKIIQMGHSQTIGMAVFNNYLLPFEIVGVFLLGGIIGAIVLAKDTSS